MSFTTFIRVGGGFPLGRSIGGGRDQSGPYALLRDAFALQKKWRTPFVQEEDNE